MKLSECPVFINLQEQVDKLAANLTLHPDPVLEVCAPLCDNRYAGFQGQVFPVTSTNFSNQILGWLPTQESRPAPCDGLFDISFISPWVRTGVRDSKNQTYVDVRVMVNGTQVAIRNNYTLIEHDSPDEADDNGIDWRQHAVKFSHCVQVSEGDTVRVEHRYKTRIIENQGPSTYNRLLVYRELAKYVFSPSPIVIGVTHA